MSVSTLIIVATSPPLAIGLLIERPVAALLIVDAVALALLGPGAHSIDAYLFGRREIIIPSDSSRRL